MKVIIKISVNMMLLIAFYMFQSCSTSLSPDLVNNSKNLESVVSQLSLSEKSCYSPIGVIPDWAKEKMTANEIKMWEQISQQYRVDYSFLLNDSWIISKERINTNLIQLQKDIDKHDIGKIKYLSIELPNRNIENNLKQLSSSEFDQNGRLNIQQTFYENGVNIHFTAHVSFIKNGNIYVYTHVDSYNFEFPRDMTFSGSKGCLVTGQGYMDVYCVGNVYKNNSFYTNIDFQKSIAF